MPSTSKKQHNFMAAIANNPSFAKKVGIPQSVGKDFSAADKGRKFEKGGATMMGKKIPSAMVDMMARRRMGAGMAPPAMPPQAPAMPPQAPAPMGMKKGGNVKESKEMVGKEMMFMKKKGAPASMIKHEKAEMGMKKGGMPMKDGKPAFMKKFAKGGGIESRGKTKGTMIRMAAGGSVSARADGIAQRGKTRC